MPAKKSEAQKTVVKTSSWYKADDEKVPFVRRQRKARAATLRSSIRPGSVLILLGGRFRGKRVVFLRQLKSGLLLVTGPHKVNGVPLKRVNQANVIATRTTVKVDGVNFNEINDEYFARTKQVARKNEQGFWAKRGELTEEQKKVEQERLQKKRQTQSAIDKTILANIKTVPLLKQYLSARFSVTKNTQPHKLVF